jgi:hypothetical protein
MFDTQSSKSSIQNSELAQFSWLLRSAIWWFGTIAWVFGIIDRSIAALSDGYFSAIDLIQISTAAFLFFCWLFLRPNSFKIRNPKFVIRN